MADEPDNIVLEHLRHIRRVVDKLDTEVTELKSCITSLESRITSFEATMGHVMAQTASNTAST